MRKEHEDNIDPIRPALIVLYGATRRKVRPLEGDVVVLGRAPGCDIGLVSPEVAPVHCILVRLATGWRIRDCSGRATRVNGQAVHDEPLRNGDTIQVGTFSFEAQLPGGSVSARSAVPTGGPAPAADRMQRSRRRLAELALSLRRRVRELTGENEQEQHALAQQQADLEQLERRLRQTHQDQTARQAQLGEQERKIAARSEELDAYARYLRRETERIRRDGEEALAQVEADLVAQRVEQNTESMRLAQWQRDLQTRQAELEATGNQLEDLLSREREQLDRDREQVAQEREYLDQERQEVVQMRGELERARDQLNSQTPPPAPPSSRETHFDSAHSPSARMESARRLLRELAERRKQTDSLTRTPRRQAEPFEEPAQ